MKKKKSYIIINIIIAIFTFSSMVECIFGFFIDFNEMPQFRAFFMSLTLIGTSYGIINYLLSEFFKENNLETRIETGLVLSQEARIESAVLLKIENDLDAEFGINKGNYHIIIVTSCFKLNESTYINAIWKNINSNVKYLYITPDSDQDFINSFIEIFKKNRVGSDLTSIYKRVTNSISHMSKKELFEILPNCYDMCIYCLDKNGQISSDDARGFCCYQNEMIDISERKYAFYREMSKEEINKVFSKYSLVFTAERILQPYLSPKIEKRNSPIHNVGLFCKSNECIKRGEVIAIKGGYELRKKDMYSSGTVNSYLPIGDDLYLAAKREEEEEAVKLYINHSCKPNTGMSGDRTFIAMRQIKEGEEITIDYAFVDNEDYVFECHCNQLDCRQRISGRDWKNNALQKKYHKRFGSSYFSTYLQKKIESSKKAKSKTS